MLKVMKGQYNIVLRVITKIRVIITNHGEYCALFFLNFQCLKVRENSTSSYRCPATFSLQFVAATSRDVTSVEKCLDVSQLAQLMDYLGKQGYFALFLLWSASEDYHDYDVIDARLAGKRCTVLFSVRVDNGSGLVGPDKVLDGDLTSMRLMTLGS